MLVCHALVIIYCHLHYFQIPLSIQLQTIKDYYIKNLLCHAGIYVHLYLDDIHHHWRGEQNQLLQIPCLFPHKICNSHKTLNRGTHTHTERESRWFICSFQILQTGRRANWVMHAHTEREKKALFLY